MGLIHKEDSIKELHEKEEFEKSLPEKLNGNDLALAELGAMAAQNEALLQGMQQAIAEIGTLVTGA